MKNSTIHMEELLRRDWRRELVRYPCGEPGPVHVEHEGRPEPAQIWRDTGGTPQVCFFTDLPALEKRCYSIRDGAASAGTDLQVEADGDRVRLGTSQFGIELPLGRFTAGVIPPPVHGLTWTDGTRFGGGSWFGETPVELESVLLARGPVLAEVRVRWTWPDGATGSLRVELAAGDCRALWESSSNTDRLERGWTMSVSGLGPLTLLGIRGKKWKDTWGLSRGVAGDVTLDDKWTGMLTRLTPWEDWWDDQAQTSWRFATPGRGPALAAAACDVGDWVEPDPPGTFASWHKRIRKMLPLCRAADGDIHLRVDQAHGRRKWLFGAVGEPVGRGLNTVKDLVLDWPDTRSRPFLFAGREDIAARRRPVTDPHVEALLTHAHEDLDAPYRYGEGEGNDHLQNAGDDLAIEAWLLTGSDEVAACTRLVERLRRRLDRLGDFDLMRYVTKVAVFFDLVSHSALVDSAERRVFRAQMAYLGHRLADPATWSMERGYRSGALNMSVSYTLNLGMVACAIPDHPAAAGWAAYATARYRQWMLEKMGPKGEWPESMHYTHVSTNEFLNYAIAARSAGFADLLAEGPLKRVMTYAAQLHAPPDPRGEPRRDPIRDFSCRRAGTRGTVPLGRAASTGGSFGHYGVLARATAETDPAFSALMQWVYRETGWNECYANESLDALRCIYPDRALPARCPDWGSEHFSTCVLLRRHTGHADEDYVLFEAGAPFTSPGESGGLMLWFWKGVPLVSRFSGGYDERAEALISNVSRAVPRTPDAPSSWSDSGEERAIGFSRLSVCDYAVLDGVRGPAHGQLHAYPPGFPPWPAYRTPADPSGIMHWRRRLLFVDDEDDDGAFLVLRDGVEGQPAGWKLWTLSEGIATPPGAAAGERYTTRGQFGVDIDVLLAAPEGTPRRALSYRRAYTYKKKLLQGFVDAQDLLHVEIPAGQSSLAALVPRRRDTPPPTLEGLADGRVVRLQRGATETHVILTDGAEPVQAGPIRCRGPAGLVRHGRESRILALPAAGELQAGEWGLGSAGPVEAAMRDERVTVRVPFAKGTRIVDLRLPGRWELRRSSASFVDPQLLATAQGWRLQIIPEVHTAVDLYRCG